jgi:hypothetical protein
MFLHSLFLVAEQYKAGWAKLEYVALLIRKHT